MSKTNAICKVHAMEHDKKIKYGCKSPKIIKIRNKIKSIKSVKLYEFFNNHTILNKSYTAIINYFILQ